MAKKLVAKTVKVTTTVEILYVSDEIRMDKNDCEYITYKVADYLDKDGVLHVGGFKTCYTKELFDVLTAGMKVAI